MSYFLSYIDKSSDNFSDVKQLSEADAKKLLSILRGVDSLWQEIVFFVIVKDNLYDFFEVCDPNKNGTSNLNRSLLNWINSFYSWIEFHEKNYQGFFPEIKKRYYDGFFEYRVAYELRKCLTHGNMVKNAYTLPFRENGNVFLIVDTPLLDAINKKSIKKELEKHKMIDLRFFSRNFFSMFRQCQNEIWNCIVDEAKRQAEFVKTQLCALPSRDVEGYLRHKSKKLYKEQIDNLSDALNELLTFEKNVRVENLSLDIQLR